MTRFKNYSYFVVGRKVL